MRGSSTQPACYCPQQRQAGSFFRIGGENRAEGETIPIGQRMIFAGLLVIEEQPRLSAFRARAQEQRRITGKAVLVELFTPIRSIESTRLLFADKIVPLYDTRSGGKVC